MLLIISGFEYIILLYNINTYNTTFESELVDLCTNCRLIISDYITFGRDSGQFTFVSDGYLLPASIILFVIMIYILS